MEQYETDRVSDSLLDLFGVEFGEVLESPSLLKSLMRAYCNTNKAKVKHIIEGVIDYAYAGSLAHFAYQSLKCQQDGQQDCDHGALHEEKNKQWNLKLYRFLKKATALKEALTYPGYGLQLDIQDDVDKLIYDEIAKNTNIEHVHAKVYYFIANKLKDINDWPEACMYNFNDKMVVVEVAELDPSVTNYNADIRPWYVDTKKTGYKLRRFELKVKPAANSAYIENRLTGQERFSCKHSYTLPGPDYYYDCEVNLPERHKPKSHDWIISFLFNFDSYKIKAQDKKNDQVTPSVFVKRRPLYVYFTTDDIITVKLNHRSYLTIAKINNYGKNEADDVAFVDPAAFNIETFKL